MDFGQYFGSRPNLFGLWPIFGICPIFWEIDQKIVTLPNILGDCPIFGDFGQYFGSRPNILGLWQIFGSLPNILGFWPSFGRLANILGDLPKHWDFGKYLTFGSKNWEIGQCLGARPQICGDCQKALITWTRFQTLYFSCQGSNWRFPDTLQEEYISSDSRSLSSLAMDAFREFQPLILI